MVMGLMAAFGFVAAAPAGAATGVPFSTSIHEPVGVAATPTQLFVTSFGSPSNFVSCNVIFSVSTTGVATAYADLSAAPLNLPCNSDEEYLAVSPFTFGTVPAGTLFVTDGPSIYTVSAGGCGNSSTCVTLFASLPNIPTEPTGGSHTGISFDNIGSFGGDLIAVAENNAGTGDVYVIPPAGGTITTPLTTIAAATDGLEAPSVLPAAWGPYAGDIITVADTPNEAYIVSPLGVVTTIPNVVGAEATAVVQASPCNFGGSSYFASLFGTDTTQGYAPATLSGLAGDVLVNSEGVGDGPPFGGVLLLTPSGGAALPTLSTFDGSAAATVQQEGGAMANCPINTTGITTSLSGGGQTGASISVPTGTAVTDTATLSGETSTAGGMVSYAVYTDSMCSMPTGGIDAGTVNVTNGLVPASNPETFTATSSPVKYYWQATYTGDIFNAGAKSTCGAEVETVVPPVGGTGSTFTPGYYKNNHDGITCTTLPSILEPALGGYTITSCADAIAILKETGCGHADGLVKCVAENVLVAELQVNKGAAFGGPSNVCIVTVANGINAANLLLANDVGPSGYAGPNGTYTITNGATAAFQAAQTELASYNGTDRNSSSSATC